MSAADAIRILLRLTSHSHANQYLIITNRISGSSLTELRNALSAYSTDNIDTHQLKETLANLTERTVRLQHDLLRAPETWWHLLRRAEIIIDNRNVDEQRAKLREQVRAARRALEPESSSWDAAGLLVGYLLSEVLAKAASASEASQITRRQLADALCIDPDLLSSVMRSRDWSVHLSASPRATDVRRPQLIEEIGRALPSSTSLDGAPVCILKGLSGIGKTSVAAAWADDRADSYAAVLWIDASTETQIEHGLSYALTWCGEDTERIGDVRERALNALARSARPWLLVFDNVSDLQRIRDWIPTRGRGHVLITTTDQTALKGPLISELLIERMVLSEATELLARRLLPGRVPSSAEQRSLILVAQTTRCWPLALEIAAAYLIDCMGGLAGANDYAKLLMRSLDDTPSVPHGYPRTLVSAINLALDRMHSRAETGSKSDGFAWGAICAASFMASRQIPFHLILACQTVNPMTLLDPVTGNSLHIYGETDPPPGEILRALKRESLLTSDEPIDLIEDEDATPSSPNHTVSINEIVQSVIRDRLSRAQQDSALLSGVALHTQHWVALFINIDRVDLAVEVLGHAISAAEHALELGIGSPNIALLLGNTAKLLGHLNYWSAAARYLRAELTYLDHVNDSSAVLRLQTASGLADATLRSSSRPLEASAEIMFILERCLTEISPAYDSNEEVTGHHVRVAMATAINLRESGERSARLTSITAALQSYCDIIRAPQGIDILKESERIQNLLSNKKYNESVTICRQILSDPLLTSFYRPEFLRLLAEGLAGLEDWDSAELIVEEIRNLARHDAVSSSTAALLARNVGLQCLLGLYTQSSAPTKLFQLALSVADWHERHGHHFPAGDSDVLEILRALRACLENDLPSCRHRIERVIVSDLRSARNNAAFDNIRSIISRWIETFYKNEEVAEPYASASPSESSSSAPAVVPEIPVTLALSAFYSIDMNVAPLFSLVMSQAACAAHKPPLSSLDVALDLVNAFRLLGFNAHLIEVDLTVWRSHGDLAMNNDPKILLANRQRHAVWVSDFERVVDPSIPHEDGLYDEFRKINTEPRPIVFQVAEHQLLSGPAIVARPPLLFEYSISNSSHKVREVHRLRQQNTISELSNLRVLLMTLTAVTMIATFNDEQSEIFRNIHPGLADFLSTLKAPSR